MSRSSGRWAAFLFNISDFPLAGATLNEAAMRRFAKTLTMAREVALFRKEATVFDIGTKGYFEDPTTEVLAFYLDPLRPHGCGDMVLRCFIETFAPDVVLEQGASAKVRTQVVTSTGKRLDLVVESDRWILAVEHKVFSHATNPFDEYELHIEKSRAGRRALLIYLSPTGASPRDAWVGVSHGSFAEHLLSCLGEHADSNKWRHYLRDFAIHLKGFMMDLTLSNEEAALVVSQWTTIRDLETLRSRYLNSVLELGVQRLKKVLPKTPIDTTMHSWKTGETALRWRSSAWRRDSDMVVAINPEGPLAGIRVVFYMGSMSPGDPRPDVSGFPGVYEEPWLECSGTVWGIGTQSIYTSVEEALGEMAARAAWFDEYQRGLGPK